MKRIACLLMILTCLCFWFVIVGGWVNTLDTSYPQGTQQPSVLDNYMREDKEAWRERLDIDHYFALTGYQISDADSGKHRQVTFREPLSADPVTIDPCEAQLYTKYVTDRPELFWTDEDETAIQLTSAGYILGTSIKLENDTYLVAVDANGADVDLIKADTKGVAVIPDQTETATNAAPVYDSAVSNKKYVDDSVDESKVILQVVNVTDSSKGACTTILPCDDTLPTIYEGCELFTLSITPHSATNKLFIQVVVQYAIDTTGIACDVALFDNDNICIAAGLGGVGGYPVGTIVINHYMTAGSDSQITFKVRYGPSYTGTVRANGKTFGGTSSTSMTITEIKA